MATRKRILIGCPHFKLYVVGSYECDSQGRYLLRPDGQFDLNRAKCGQRGGVCQQSLCVLHRFNRRGKGTWFPTDILADRSEVTQQPPEKHAHSSDLF